MSEMAGQFRDWGAEIENPEAPATLQQKELFVRRCLELSDSSPDDQERERSFGVLVFPTPGFVGTKVWFDIDNLDVIEENSNATGLRRARVFMNVPEVIDNDFYRHTYPEYTVDFRQNEDGSITILDEEYGEFTSVFNWDGERVPLPGGYSFEDTIERAKGQMELEDALGIKPNLFSQSRFVEVMRLMDLVEFMKVSGEGYEELPVPAIEYGKDTPLNRLIDLVEEKTASYRGDPQYPGLKEVGYNGTDKQGRLAGAELITFDFSKPIHPHYEYARQEGLLCEIIAGSDFSDDDPFMKETKFIMTTYKIFDLAGETKIVKKVELQDFADDAFIMEFLRGEIDAYEFFHGLDKARERLEAAKEDELEVENFVAGTKTHEVEDEEIEDLIRLISEAEPNDQPTE